MSSDDVREWAWLGALMDCPARPAALRHALGALGFDRQALLRGLASQLRVTVRQLEQPDEDAIARCRRARVGASIPIMLEHSEAWLVTVGRRWLVAPGLVFEVDPAVLERWLSTDVEIGHSLAPALERDGLALLGPRALRRLAESAPASTRELAASWVQRLAR